MQRLSSVALLLVGCGRTGFDTAPWLPTVLADASTVDGATTDGGRCLLFDRTPPGLYATTSAPGNVLPGDFTGDGRIDILVDEGQGDPGELFTNNATDAFSQSPLQASTANNYGNAVAGDFNGDGRLDVASQANGVLEIDFGVGGGALLSTLTSIATPYQEGILAQGDFNGDGRPDLAFAGITMGPPPVGGRGLPGPVPKAFGLVVYLNSGGGTFASPATYASATTISGLATGDLDGDGRLDLVAAAGDSLAIYINAGDGTFGDALLVHVSGLGPYGLAVGDFDSDGLDDIATTTVTDADAGSLDVLDVFTSRAGGTLNAPIADVLVSSPQFGKLVVGDFNGDGLPDLATVFAGSRGGTSVPSAPIAVFLNQGGGHFGGAVTYATRTDGLPDIQSFASADFNGDGVPDLVVSTGNEDFESPNEVAVLLSRCAQR